MERIGPRHSSWLWFQMLGVEAHSFLPHDQGDGGHLARQGQTRHLWPDSLGHQRIVKLFERARLGSRYGCSTFEYILQFVIVIAIQSANRGRLLRPLQLSLDEALLGAAASRCQIRCRSRAAAWYGKDAVFESKRSAEPPGPGQ